MYYVTRRPTTSRCRSNGPTAILLVIATSLALIAGCAGPDPSSAPADSPGASPTPDRSAGSSAAPSAGPGETPSTPPPAELAWEPGVDLLPLAPVASFEATKPTLAGVLVDTAFRLTALDGSNSVALARLLVAEPPLDLTVTENAGVALVTPRTPLGPGGSYRFSLRSPDGTVRATWAVQAVGPLAVAGMLPYDEATDVPVDTGIEIRFNQSGVTAADVERFLVVEPATAGRVEVEGRVAAFIADQPLARATLYTVTVKAGLPLAGTPETLQRDVVTRFETSGVTGPRAWLRVERSLVEASPADRPTINVLVDTESDDESPTPTPERVAFTVHRLAGLAAAVDAWREIEAAPYWSRTGAAPIETSGLPLSLEGDAKLHKFTTWNDWEQYLRLPASLDAGWYVVTLRVDGSADQAVLQSTDLALYTIVTTTRSIAWVNDLATGGPIEGAAVTVGGIDLGRTGADGVVVGRTPGVALDPVADLPAGIDPESAAASAVVVARTGSRAVFAPGGERLCGKCVGADLPSTWWLSFTPDRYQYRSTDTINAWGIVRDRASGDAPARVEVTLDAWSETEDVATSAAHATAEPDRNGAFLVRLPVSGLPYGGYELTLRVDGRAVAAQSIEVTRILKPAWTMTLVTSRHAAIEGSSVDVTATAAFFEGTPVAGAAIRVAANGRSAILETDTSGTGVAPLQMRLRGNWSQWDVVTVSGRPTLPEEGEIRGQAGIAVFQAGVIIRSSPVVDGDTLRVAGTVHQVALDRFEDPDVAWLGDVDPHGRPVAGTTVRIKVIEHRTIHRKVGTTYDWILKRVVPLYRDRERTTTLGTWTVRTDAKGRFRLSLPAGKDRAYVVKLAATDSQGRTTTDEAWADAVVQDVPSQLARIEGGTSDEGFSVGDRIPLRFVGGQGAGEPATYLWTTAQAGLRSWEVTSRPRFTDTFRAGDVPGFAVNAVRFTGTGYVVAADERVVTFRAEDRRMTITVTPNRARYEPGGRVSLVVRTTDGRGRAVPASVYLSVVDEKLVSMGSVDMSDPLDALYQGVGSGIVGITWTHRDPRPSSGGGEGGDTTGGGGDGSRSDFRDWLVARLVRTGADGRATVTFDLSDDLTSWHAFASGVSRSLLAGRGDTLIPVSLPFFAELTMADSYLASDRPIVRVRAYGGGLRAGETVRFTVSSETLPMAAITVTAPAFEAAEVPLPDLGVGTHRLRVEARSGSGNDARRDALIRTFTVVERRAVAASVSRATLDEPMDIPAGDGFTTLVLADGGRGRVVPVLEGLAATDPTRGDRALAAGIAARVLRDVFGIEDADGRLDTDLDAFSQHGGFAILPYAQGNLELSVLAALADDPRVGALSFWDDDEEPTTREEQIWLLAGRAATGSPSLGEIRETADLPDLTVHEQVALALAALAAGDEALAARLERDVLRDHGERYGPWVRVRADGSDDEATVLTARLAIVAASLGDDVAAGMDAYLEANPPRTTVLDLERALAARGWALRVPAADAAATLTVDGASSAVRIEASRPVTIVLTPAQARGASLAPVSGSVVVAIRTDRPLDPASLAAPDWLAPARVIKPSTSIGVTDAVVVELRVTAPARASEGCWIVTEWVPSGLVPVASTSGWMDDEEEDVGGDGPLNVQGQRLDFCLQRPTHGRAVTLRYVARVVTPGTYTWEPAVVQSPLDPSVGAVIPATTITIRGER